MYLAYSKNMAASPDELRDQRSAVRRVAIGAGNAVDAFALPDAR